MCQFVIIESCVMLDKHSTQNAGCCCQCIDIINIDNQKEGRKHVVNGFILQVTSC